MRQCIALPKCNWAVDALKKRHVLCTKRLLTVESDMDVTELSYTADLLRHSLDGAQDASACSLLHEEFVKQLMQSYEDCKLVFSAHHTTVRAKVGEHHHHLSTGLSNDHLFVSLLENGLIQDMLTLYTERQIHSVLRFGTPVCGHPTIVHGGMISALFDETFGVLLYAAGRWGHLDLQQVFTARLEVDYKKPLPAQSTVVCTATVEKVEGRKIWVAAQLTDPSQQTLYAASRALFIKPREVMANGLVVNKAENGIATNASNQ